MRASRRASNPSSGSGLAPSDRALAFWLAAFLFGIYLLSFSGRIISSDGLSMFAVTESVMKRGDFSTDQMWSFFGPKSIPMPDGEIYSKYGYGSSLFAAPFYALALYVPFSGMMQVAMLSNALAVAASGGLLLLAARRLTFTVRVAIAVTLLFGLATPAWVYAKEFWSESFGVLTLLAAFYFLLCYRQGGETRDALLAGIALGLAIAVRTTNVLLLPLYAWYGFVEFDAHKRSGLPLQISWRELGAFVLPLLLFLGSIFLYNDARYGNPFTSGYRPDETFSNNILLGAYGLLFSPGKGLLVYSPFLAALPFGIWQFSKRFRRELIFSVLLFAVYCLLFSAWYYWSGGTNWAARFLVPTLPFLVLLCAPLVALVLTRPHTRAHLALIVVFALLVAISFVNELAGISINPVTFRVSTLARSNYPDWDAIFSPALSPLIGYWQIFKPTNLEFGWLRATSEQVQVDWLALALTLGIILFALYRIVQTLRGQTMPRVTQRINLVLMLALIFIVLARYANDPRLGGNAGYQKLMETLQTQSTAHDVLILGDDGQARYIFNTNRAPLKWYALSRDPARWDDAMRALVSRLAHEYPRVWFAYDESAGAPNPLHEWFQENLQALQTYSFPDGVHLVLYGGTTP